MFQKEIERYEQVRAQYEQHITKKMSSKDLLDWHEVLFSCHSCAIEGNSFTLDDTRLLQEQGLGMVPVGRSLLECTEIADHFRAFRFITSHLDDPFDENLLKETHRLVTQNTLAYRVPDAVPGEYTTCDMAAGDTLFGDHKKLIARVPSLLESTAKAIDSDIHPVIVAARFHGFFEYLHPFRDGNGRTGRLLSNFILLQYHLPELIICKEDRQEYINALKAKRTEGTDEFLIAFFFKAAIKQMQDELDQKHKGSRPMLFF